MYKEAQLVFRSYMPDNGLKKGMLFLTRLSNEPHVYELNTLPSNKDEFIKINGYPVEPYIIDEGNPNIYNDGVVYAHPHQIGWFDEGDHSDELYDIEIRNMNKIVSEYDGWVYIEVDDEGFPILYDDKVTISYADVEEDYEMDEDADDVNNDDDDDKIF